MSYEYIYLNQRGMSLPEFMEKLNEYGEEGYHLVQQDTFGIFLLERQVYPELAAASTTSLQRSGVFISDATLLLICAFTLILVLAIVARDFHWV